MIVFLISLLYCVLILSITYFFIYTKTKFSIVKIIAFGAGFLSTLVVLEFLPHAFSTHVQWYFTLLLIASGWCINVLAELWVLPRMRFLNTLLPVEKHDCHQHDSTHVHHHLLPSSMGCSAMGCFILCAFFDGIRLNSGWLIDFHTAILICIGLLFHLLPESITIIGIGLSSGFSKKTLSNIIILFCLSFMAGSLSFFVASYIPILSAVTIAIASGLFIYICSVHLIPISIKLKQIKWFLIGVVTCVLLIVSTHWISHDLNV